MGVYCITTTVEFSYGHRILGHPGKCRHVHGHNGTVELDLEAAALDRFGMVCDFADAKGFLRGWLDRELDHRMLLAAADPLVDILRAAGEPVVVTEQPPTAEHLASLVWHAAAEAKLPVVEVRLWETSTSRASYRRPQEGGSS